MLGKLAYRNAKRSLKDYLIYLITITISFSLILAFNLVASSDAVVKLSSGMGSFKHLLNFINFIIVFVVCFLINYTTKFMFEKRSKELGTYMLLGIKKKEITKMFVIENTLLGFFALLLSIPFGFIFSQFVSLVIVKVLGIPEVVFISMNITSIGLLLIYYLIIYFLVLVNMLLKIKRMTVHNFLYFDKQNEKKMFYSSKKRNTIFVISLFIGIASLVLWNLRFSMENYSETKSFTYLMISMIGLIISIYGVSATSSDMFLSFLLKSKRLKYQKDNLFVTRTFASKARTMSFTFGTLSMLILFSILSLNFSSGNEVAYQSSIELTTPYDIIVRDEKQFFDEYIDVIEEDYTVNEVLEYDIYKEPKNQIQKYYSEFCDFDSMMKLSDYNQLLKMRNMDTITLQNNEYLIITSSRELYKVEDNENIKKIQLSNGVELHLKGIETKPFWYSISYNGQFVMVVPDNYVQGLEISDSHLIIDTKEETKASLYEKICDDMAYQLCKVDDEGETNCQYYRVSVRGVAIEKQNSTTAINTSICLYIAFIFISVVGTILAIHSLSDATKYKYRYLTLRRLGVNDKSLNKTIRKQLFILFGVPVIYSIICSFCMVVSVNNAYPIISKSNYTYLLYFAGSLAIFFLIYGVYWIATYIGFKSNINE